MRRNPSRLLGAAWIVLMLVFLTAMFAASYFLTGYLYKIADLNPPVVLVQVINSILGLVLTGLIVGGIGRIANGRGWAPERNVFNPIVEALEKIAKGDFSTRVEGTAQDNQMVSVLANSVNNLALELKQMEDMRQEFISNVSHEIQSPLTSIHGFAEALQNEALSPQERRHYLEIIESESTRLSRITADLLKLAALESEHPKFEPKPYRLDRQIRSQILACEPLWAGKELDMAVTLEEVEINADEDLLSQVWANLIHNSIKFTPQGGKVCIELRRLDNIIEFKIRDTGIGIGPEDLEHIFERFYKADRSRTRADGGSPRSAGGDSPRNDGGGSGLGLAIAKKIIDMHGGQIQVESAPGMGTTFTVTLKP